MEETGERWRLGHRLALDGLRGIAIVLVFLSHAAVPHLPSAGTVGVTVFFTLSGFLITALLLAEQAATGRIDLRNFYVRRARRLLPALFAFVTVLVALGLVVGPWLAELRDVPATVLYASNWVRLSGRDMGAMAHTWSLSVEEQFYTLWPLVVIVVMHRFGARVLAWVALIGAGASVVVRFAVWDMGDGWVHVYYGSDARADGLLAGCALAAVMHQGRAGTAKVRLAWFALALIGVTTMLPKGAEFLLAPTFAPWLTALIIWALVRGPYVGSLTYSPLRWLGRRSYGLYLWHVPVAVSLRHWFDLGWQFDLLIMVPTSLALTVLSWRLVEVRWLRSGRQDRSPDPEVAERRLRVRGVERESTSLPT